jgi:hypothetical protein
MITTPYYRDRAQRWASEVRGLRVGTPERSAALREIAERCYTTVDTVAMWIKLVEREVTE